MRFIKTVLLTVIFIGLSQRSWSSDTPHVAVLDFTLAQSPGSTDPGVLDFSRAVQAKLFSNNDFAWVERQEFERISREIDVGDSSRADPATAVRLGHLLHADLMLRGEITPRSAEVSDLTIEVIDLKRADILVARVFPISSSAQKRVHPTVAEVDATSRGTVELLRAAGDRLKEMNALRVLAPLYFKNTSKSDRLVFLEDRLKKAFGDEATPATGFRVLRFPRLGEAGEESSLVLSGLTDTDPDAWQHIADAYVWGTFSEEGRDGMTFEDVPVAITVKVWNGTGDPREIKWTGPVKDLDVGEHAIASQVLALARAGLNGGESKGGERQRLAEDLANQAAGVALQLRQDEPFDLDSKSPPRAYFESSAGRQQYGYWLRLLEVACFFDPLNAVLQKSRLQVAWSAANPFKPAATLRGLWLRAADFHLQARRFERVADGSLDPFWLKSQSENFAEFATILYDAEWKGKAFASSQAEVHRQLGYAMEKWSQFVVQSSEAVKREPRPPDWYDAQRRAWFEQISALRYIDDPVILHNAFEQIWPVLENEFGRMLHADGGDRETPERWTTLLFSVYQSFADTSRPYAMLDSAWNSYHPAESSRPSPGTLTEPATARPPRPELPWRPWVSPQPAPLPPGVTNSAIPQLAASIREIDPRSLTTYARTKGTDDSLLVKRRAYNLSVDALAFEAGRLWFTEENEVLPAALGTPNPSGAHYLWSYDPALRASELITAKLGAHSIVRDLAGAGGSVWLGFDGDGVWRLDPETGAIKRFKGEDGLQTSRILATATYHDQLYFVGGTAPDLFISQYSPTDNKWTSMACPLPEWPSMSGL